MGLGSNCTVVFGNAFNLITSIVNGALAALTGFLLYRENRKFLTANLERMEKFENGNESANVSIYVRGYSMDNVYVFMQTNSIWVCIGKEYAKILLLVTLLSKRNKC